MTEREIKVWAAIEAVLKQVGDTDMQASLQWLEDADKQLVAEAAIKAASQE